jgi:hypothetical protein
MKNEDTIKSANALFQWQGSFQYQDKKFQGNVVAKDYKDAVSKFINSAVQSWYGKSTAQQQKLLQAYIVEHPTKFNVKLKDPLPTVVKRYALSKKYQNPGVALDQCKIASRRLKEFLQKLGFDAVVLRLKGPKFGTEKALPKWRKLSQHGWIHYVVQVGNTIYDLTNRQFDPDCAYPLIQTRTELNKKWSEVTNEQERNTDNT